jgi:hypothetical protein
VAISGLKEDSSILQAMHTAELSSETKQAGSMPENVLQSNACPETPQMCCNGRETGTEGG